MKGEEAEDGKGSYGTGKEKAGRGREKGRNGKEEKSRTTPNRAPHDGWQVEGKDGGKKGHKTSYLSLHVRHPSLPCPDSGH